MNAKLYIEDLQRAMKTLPKSVPANDPANENRMRQQELALKIFAAHIGIDAVNGSRRGKSLNVTRDFAREGDAALALAGNKAMQDWLWNTPYDRLRKLILTGHGGEMEKDFRSYLLRQPEIPAGTPGRFLPTAKTRCEALQAQLRAARAGDGGPRRGVPRADHGAEERLAEREKARRSRDERSAGLPRPAGKPFGEDLIF